MFEESEHLDKPIEAKKTDKLICLKIHERIYAFIVLEDRCESFRPWWHKKSLRYSLYFVPSKFS